MEGCNGPKARPAAYRWTSGAGWAHMRPLAMMLWRWRR